ncbi:heterokaryon incompatibility protein-domain-containing protein [Halenospora varia]|nr:heterokaryon incompatibility protein-domain-containing protein [Halenospora varia]
MLLLGRVDSLRRVFRLSSTPRTWGISAPSLRKKPLLPVKFAFLFHTTRLLQHGSKRRLPPFRHTRLNWASHEIRLIKILPPRKLRNADEEPIECTIESVSLESKPQYIALSYAWGDNTRDQPLVLNGKLTYITSSLQEALQQLRSSNEIDKKTEGRPVWVDAICINQEDDVEKSWQVQQMGRIFHDAYRVIVWLGPASDSSSMAMEILEQIGVRIKDGNEPVHNSALELFTSLPELPENFGEALNDLLSRSWWKRVWVVQEFAVGKNTIFLCGDTSLWWQFAYDALKVLDRQKRVLLNTAFAGMIGGRAYVQSMDEMAVISSTLDLFKIRSEWNHDRKAFSLWDLLKLKDDGMQASDHRDIIYAMTGIAEDAQKQHLYPDYTKRVQDVFTQVAKTFLAQGRLRMLWLCAQPRDLVGLPSWVPDWSSSWRSNYRYLSSDRSYGINEKIFSASGDSRPIVSFSTSDSKALLHLGGCEFDTIAHIGSCFDVGTFLKTLRFDFHHIHQGIAERFREVSRLQSLEGIYEENWKDTVIRTAVFDIELSRSLDIRFTYNRSNTRALRELYSKYLSENDEWAFDNTNDMPASKLDILFRHHGRRPFLTSEGYLGLGPANLQQGDIVAIIYGSDVPIVFRKTSEEKYLLIGEAYVDGAMDGQVLEMDDQSTTFDIL